MVLPETTPPQVKEAFELLQAQVSRLEHIVKLKDEQIRFLNLRFFGPKGEKLSSNQVLLLLEEASVTAQEVVQEAEQPEEQKQLPIPPQGKPRAEHPGREKLPDHLERREEVIACAPQDCRCSKCGGERPIIGYESKEELMCKPAEFWVKVTKREKRGSALFGRTRGSHGSSPRGDRSKGQTFQ